MLQLRVGDNTALTDSLRFSQNYLILLPTTPVSFILGSLIYNTDMIRTCELPFWKWIRRLFRRDFRCHSCFGDIVKIPGPETEIDF